MKTQSLKLVTLLLGIAAAGCGGDGESISGLPEGDAVVAAVATDYVSSSVFSRVVLPSQYVDIDGIDGITSTDPVVRLRGGYIFVINRFGFNNITILRADNFSLVGQISTGEGSNPQDVSILGEQVYVATFGGTGLVTFNLGALDVGVTAIDLSSLDPDDGVPNCVAVETVGTYIYVACKRSDDGDDFLTPRGAGEVAIVTATGELVDTVTLEHASPTGFFARQDSADLLYIATVPNFFAPADDGCIEIIATGPEPQYADCLIDNQAVGGYVSDLEYASGRLYATVVSGFDPEDFGPLGQAGAIDLESTTPELEPFTASEVRAFDLAHCPATGRTVVSDATAGLRVYDASGVELTEAALDIGAPPVQAGTVCIDALTR